MNVRQWVPLNWQRDDRALMMADSLNNTCYPLRRSVTNLEETSKTLILDGKKVANADEVTVTLEGTNLYCDVFDVTCTKLALQVLARSDKDDPLNEKCKPFCGKEVTCMLVYASSTRSQCDLKCECPPGGCQEIIVVFSEGVIAMNPLMEVCEIKLSVSQ